MLQRTSPVPITEIHRAIFPRASVCIWFLLLFHTLLILLFNLPLSSSSLLQILSFYWQIISYCNLTANLRLLTRLFERSIIRPNLPAVLLLPTVSDIAYWINSIDTEIVRFGCYLKTYFPAILKQYDGIRQEFAWNPFASFRSPKIPKAWRKNVFQKKIL